MKLTENILRGFGFSCERPVDFEDYIDGRWWNEFYLHQDSSNEGEVEFMFALREEGGEFKSGVSIKTVRQLKNMWLGFFDDSQPLEFKIYCNPKNSSEVDAIAEFMLSNNEYFSLVENVKLYMVQNCVHYITLTNNNITFSNKPEGAEFSVTEFIEFANSEDFSIFA